MNTTGTTPYIARRGLRDVIMMYQADAPKHRDNIVRVDRTNFIAETKMQFSGLGNARVMTEGSQTTWDTVTTPYKKEFLLLPYGLGFQASVQAYEYDPYGVMSRYKEWMSRGHYFAKEIAAASLINNLTNSSYLGIDGVVLGSASHPTSSSTFSNYTTGTFSETGLSAMRVLLLGQVDYRDRPWMPASNHNVLIPVAQEVVAQKIFQSSKLPYSADNTANVVPSFFNYTPGNPHFTGTVWGVVPANKRDNPLFMLIGNEMDVRDDYSIDNHSKKVLAVSEFCVGADRAQGTYFSSGA